MFTYLGAMGLGGEVSPTRVTTTGWWEIWVDLVSRAGLLRRTEGGLEGLDETGFEWADAVTRLVGRGDGTRFRLLVTRMALRNMGNRAHLGGGIALNTSSGIDLVAYVYGTELKPVVECLYVRFASHDARDAIHPKLAMCHTVPNLMNLEVALNDRCGDKW